jgi:chromate transporter
MSNTRPPSEWESPSQVSYATIAKEWGKLGITGFGGPQAHIVLLRKLVVDRFAWIDEEEFEHAVATTNLLPGPASTQLAIYCGWRLRRTFGALLAGFCFISPGLILIIAAGALILSNQMPPWLSGATLGAGAVIPIIALRAGTDLLVPSWKRVVGSRAVRIRWVLWMTFGALATLTLGGALILALLACGLIELMISHWKRRREVGRLFSFLPIMAATTFTSFPLLWTAIKVGALSFGGGFVIIPLMRADAVARYHWMTNTQFVSAVALGQLTPGPVVQTIAVVGYAASGLTGAFIAAGIAFAPSFLFVILGGPFFERFRDSMNAQAFLSGASPATIGAILGTSILLAQGIIHLWQIPLLGLGVVWLLGMRRGTVSGLLGGALIGAVGALCGLPL